MSRLELSKIPSLTFYKDSLTKARRSDPIPQLICRGAPCKLYTPEAVRCVSLPGGYGTEVDWKCEGDLPDTLRFGRVEVSCEGWSGPGDPYVLKGSCSLEYRLVQVPGILRDTTDSPFSSWRSYDLSTIVFFVLWVAFLAFIIYGFLKHCLSLNGNQRARNFPPPPPPPYGPRSGGTGGWFPGGMDEPPPYPKPEGNQGWRPGFWTGAALGGFANHLINRQRPEPRVAPVAYDWERVPGASFFGGRRTPPVARYDDRGEGPSNLGAMRRSTGLGGSTVR